MRNRTALSRIKQYASELAWYYDRHPEQVDNEFVMAALAALERAWIVPSQSTIEKGA